MNFAVTDEDASVEVRNPELIVVGYSGRDTESVQAHVEELSRQGIPPPSHVPLMWRLPDELLSQEQSIAVANGSTSGEAEPVLLFTRDGRYVTVGSDHTDRALERSSIVEAKRACPKIVGRECWPLESVRGQWDSLRLESDIEAENEQIRYQTATLGYLLPVEWFLDQFGHLSDAVVFCGTIPLVSDLNTNANAFVARLIDGSGDRMLAFRYSIHAR